MLSSDRISKQFSRLVHVHVCSVECIAIHVCIITTLVGPACVTDASPVNTTPGSSSPLPWVGGGIIGAVLSAAILVTVLAAVCLLKRKRTHSQHKMYDNN